MVWLVGLLAGACGPGPASLPGSSDASHGETSHGETNPAETADTSESGEATESDDPTETGPEPECGDGRVDAGEQCDEGPANAWEHATCQPDCTFNECGDGLVGLDELCDPGTGGPDSCTLGCLMLCNGKIYECGDMLDNDRDGLVDLDDPDCLGPCDNAEHEFALHLPSGGNDCKSDCAFDSNLGSADDKCQWNFKCDPLNPGATFGCDHQPEFMMCDPVQPPACLEFCASIAPNGCDCFACCEIDGVFRYIGEGSKCGSNDPSACPACTPNPSCFNPCESEACELCFLQTLDDLAPGCSEPSCPALAQPCTTILDCPLGEYCQLGCCRAISPG